MWIHVLTSSCFSEAELLLIVSFPNNQMKKVVGTSSRFSFNFNGPPTNYPSSRVCLGIVIKQTQVVSLIIL
jgi:hypothetical protein